MDRGHVVPDFVESLFDPGFIIVPGDRHGCKGKEQGIDPPRAKEVPYVVFGIIEIRLPSHCGVAEQQ
jgi:hypothetical protein